MTKPLLTGRDMIPHNNSIFHISPIPLWLEDFSEIKQQLDLWRKQGIEDLRQYLLNNTAKVAESASKIKILQVNSRTLELYEAEHLEHLCENLPTIFQQDMLHDFGLICELRPSWDLSMHNTMNLLNCLKFAKS